MFKLYRLLTNLSFTQAFDGLMGMSDELQLEKKAPFLYSNDFIRIEMIQDGELYNLLIEKFQPINSMSMEYIMMHLKLKRLAKDMFNVDSVEFKSND